MYAILSASTLPKGWTINKFDDGIQYVQLQQQQLGILVIISHVLLIWGNLTWEQHTANHIISPESDILCQQSMYLTAENVKGLSTILITVIFVPVTHTTNLLNLPEKILTATGPGSGPANDASNTIVLSH